MAATLVDVRCGTPGCQNLLGRTDGPHLYLATSLFKLRVTIHCRYCGLPTPWIPQKGPKP